MDKKHYPLALIILDGWGYREAVKDNAIASAKLPHWQRLWNECPHVLLNSSGMAVGLPEGQMGNSEVGHLTIGAGRVIFQELTRIDQAIAQGDFNCNPVLLAGISKAIAQQRAIHIMGLLSPGGVHSHEKHIHAAVELAAAQGIKRIYIHAFLDGRDTPPQSAASSLARLEAKLEQLGCGKIVSLVGRYYAMDRDKRWERIATAYNLLTCGKAAYHCSDSLSALQQAYERGETDEFVSATSIHDPRLAPVTMQAGDVVLFMNFRADRARQITQALTAKEFSDFERDYVPALSDFIGLTQYADYLSHSIAFPPQTLVNTLGACLANHGLKQLRIAETEKYAHVTFFFNGGVEQPYRGEERLLVASPQVATYDLKPEMSAIEMTEKLVAAILSSDYDVIVCNYANPDMLGHTGNLPATVSALETIDSCLNQVISALKKVGGEAIITADHGNAECMRDELTQQPHTAHTTEPVPFIYVGRQAKITKASGTLADIAPTILYLLNLPVPTEMTGNSLISLN